LIDRPSTPAHRRLGFSHSDVGQWPTRRTGATSPDFQSASELGNRNEKTALSCLGQWPTGSARAGSMDTPSIRSRLPLGRPDREREERAVRKLQVPAGHLHLAFTAAFALDHEFSAHRKPTGKTARTERHGNLLQRRHPGTPMCRSIDRLHGRRIYPRYPQWRTCHAPDGPISPPHV
jgi:hypothetical protein